MSRTTASSADASGSNGLTKISACAVPPTKSVKEPRTSARETTISSSSSPISVELRRIRIPQRKGTSSERTRSGPSAWAIAGKFLIELSLGRRRAGLPFLGVLVPQVVYQLGDSSSGKLFFGRHPSREYYKGKSCMLLVILSNRYRGTHYD